MRVVRTIPTEWEQRRRNLAKDRSNRKPTGYRKKAESEEPPDSPNPGPRPIEPVPPAPVLQPVPQSCENRGALNTPIAFLSIIAWPKNIDHARRATLLESTGVLDAATARLVAARTPPFVSTVCEPDRGRAAAKIIQSA